MEHLTIKGDADKVTVAGILLTNGYTVKIGTVKEGNKAVKVLFFEKNKKEKEV